MSAIEKATRVIDKYVQKQAETALNRVKKEQHGNGCGCSTCAHLWVKEINYWLELSGSLVFFEVETIDNNLKITGPHEY